MSKWAVSAPARIDLCCAACNGRDGMRDVGAMLDVEQQQWVLGSVFDEGACEACGSDATLMAVTIE